LFCPSPPPLTHTHTHTHSLIPKEDQGACNIAWCNVCWSSLLFFCFSLFFEMADSTYGLPANLQGTLGIGVWGYIINDMHTYNKKHAFGICNWSSAQNKKLGFFGWSDKNHRRKEAKEGPGRPGLILGKGRKLSARFFNLLKSVGCVENIHMMKSVLFFPTYRFLSHWFFGLFNAWKRGKIYSFQ